MFENTAPTLPSISGQAWDFAFIFLLFGCWGGHKYGILFRLPFLEKQLTQKNILGGGGVELVRNVRFYIP